MSVCIAWCVVWCVLVGTPRYIGRCIDSELEHQSCLSPICLVYRDMARSHVFMPNTPYPHPPTSSHTYTHKHTAAGEGKGRDGEIVGGGARQGGASDGAYSRA